MASRILPVSLRAPSRRTRLIRWPSSVAYQLSKFNMLSLRAAGVVSTVIEGILYGRSTMHLYKFGRD